jgi:hypothetical protein
MGVKGWGSAKDVILKGLGVYRGVTEGMGECRAEAPALQRRGKSGGAEAPALQRRGGTARVGQAPPLQRLGKGGGAEAPPLQVLRDGSGCMGDVSAGVICGQWKYSERGFRRIERSLGEVNGWTFEHIYNEPAERV